MVTLIPGPNTHINHKVLGTTLSSYRLGQVYAHLSDYIYLESGPHEITIYLVESVPIKIVLKPEAPEPIPNQGLVFNTSFATFKLDQPGDYSLTVSSNVSECKISSIQIDNIHISYFDELSRLLD